MQSSILVFGSINCDITLFCDRHPRKGETLDSDVMETGPGGKAGNQAAAASVFNSGVQLVGCVGDDEFGRMLLCELGAMGVGLRHVLSVSGRRTGMAVITVDKAGDNHIVGFSGANLALRPENYAHLADMIAGTKVVVLQTGMPNITIRAVIDLAEKFNKTIIINPSPASSTDIPYLRRATYVVLNEVEAATLSEITIASEENAEACARALHSLGISAVVLTQGSAGCLYLDKMRCERFAAPRVKAVDTTGAGDAFLGSFAAGIASRADLGSILRQALDFASNCVQRRGAMSSYDRDYNKHTGNLVSE